MSGRVCLPFHETFSSLSTLQCSSAVCGKAGGGGVDGVRSCSSGRGGEGGAGGGISREAESMDIENEGGGEGQVRPPSPPQKPFSQCRR